MRFVQINHFLSRLSALVIMCGALVCLNPAANAQPLQQARGGTQALPAIRAWTGDFDGMQRRRTVRLLVPYSRTLYFIDKGRQMGVVAEFGRAFEDWLNKRHAKSHLRMHVVFVPAPRERMFDMLADGLGDAIAANLTITPERQARADFATPWLRDVREIVVTGPTSPSLTTLDDLAGQTVHVRASSSYAGHLATLAERLAAAGKPALVVKPVSENLEDEDLLEMVSAGMLPFAVVDAHKADTWVKILPGLTARSDLALHTGGEVAWALRKGSPLLKAELDAFFVDHKQGTSFGNTIGRRYFGGTKAVRRALSESEARKYRDLIGFFITHGTTTALDPVMLAAQGYQESTLDQSRRSPRGAVGVMQLLPSTAAAPPISITGVDRDADNNIRAGATYMRYLMTTYVKDPQLDPVNRMLMTFAAYNAGPGNLRKFRRIAKEKGLNPDIWFNNVEQGAAAAVGRETVQYVSNIYKYYTAYNLALELDTATQAARQRVMPKN